MFDRDFKAVSKNQEAFNAAILCAYNHDIKLAISNDAFELWYLLHYEYYSSQTHRNNLIKMLEDKDRLNEKYKKNSSSVYQKLEARQETAIKNAQKLWESHPSSASQNPLNALIVKHNQNPSTTVHLLVEEIQKYLT